jgi:hypothetical protein
MHYHLSSQTCPDPMHYQSKVSGTMSEGYLRRICGCGLALTALYLVL